MNSFEFVMNRPTILSYVVAYALKPSQQDAVNPKPSLASFTWAASISFIVYLLQLVLDILHGMNVTKCWCYMVRERTGMEEKTEENKKRSFQDIPLNHRLDSYYPLPECLSLKQNKERINKKKRPGCAVLVSVRPQPACSVANRVMLQFGCSIRSTRSGPAGRLAGPEGSLNRDVREIFAERDGT